MSAYRSSFIIVLRIIRADFKRRLTLHWQYFHEQKVRNLGLENFGHLATKYQN